MLQGCLNGVKEFFKSVSRIFLKSCKGVSRVFQMCFKEVSRKCSRCFKEVSCLSLITATPQKEGLLESGEHGEENEVR